MNLMPVLPDLSLFLAAGAGENPLDHVLEHVVDHPILTTGESHSPNDGWWFLTNHMVMMLVAAALMLLIFPRITRRYRSGEFVPTGTRNFFEAILLYVRNDIAKPVLGDHTDRFMPFLWTLFFFILFMNLLGLIPFDLITTPIVRLVTGDPDAHGLYGTATANPYVTAVLALFSFVMIHYHGIRANGLGTYLKHFLGGAPWYMAPVMIPVEIIGMLVKPFALFLRLAANMTAGHILLAVLLAFPAVAAIGARDYGSAVLIGIPSVIGAVAIMCMELFVALLQAYLFAFLTALFIAQMVVHEHDDHEEHGEHGYHDEAHEVVGSGNLGDFAKLPDDARQAGTHAAG